MDPIQMTVCYPGAGSVAAVLLGVSGNIIRLAMDGWEDAGEFRLVGGQWLSEDNEPVEIDSKPDPWSFEESGEILSLLAGVCPAPPTRLWVN